MQVGVLGEEVTAILLLYVLLSLEVETLGWITKKLHQRIQIYQKKSGSFAKASEEQQNVDIHILSIEMELAQHNKSLGTFTLNVIVPAARGVQRLKLFFIIMLAVF